MEQQINTDQAKTEMMEAIGTRDPYSAVGTWRYALNMMNATSPLTPMAYDILAALEASADKMNVTLPPDWTKDGARYEAYRRGPRKPVERGHWDAVKATLQQNMDILKGETFSAPPLLQNMDEMARALELDIIARATLELLCLRFLDMGCSTFLQGIVSDDQGQLIAAMPALFNRPEARNEVSRIFDVSSPLVKYGFMSSRGSTNGRARIPNLEDSLVAKMSTPGLTGDEVIGRILGTSVTPTLELGDFGHLGQKLDFIVRRLKAAIKNHEQGVNILIYGEPGVGKTEMAGALSKRLGVKLYAVGEERERRLDFGAAIAGIGQIRLGELNRAQGLLRKSSESLLMFDEFEDLLIKGGDSDKVADTSNKVQLNRTLENNEIPTIWLGNKPWKLETAVKQRFTYSLFMDTPPTLVRERIWQRRCEMSKVRLDTAETLRLARTYAAPPRMIAQAVATVAATGKGSDLEASLDASIMVGSGHEQVKLRSPVPAQFSPRLLTDKVVQGRSLSALIKAGLAEHPFRLLVQGLEGSGASTGVRYLAEQINLNPLEVSMEDLRRPGPPPPEERIASTFSFAASHNRFLIVNDVEHLLVDPQAPGSGRLHKSLAHAFRKAAEAHKLPFAATTEQEILPDALQIWFSDHLICGLLSAVQTRKAYRHFFGKEAPKNLRGPLYIGDFAEADSFLKFMEGSSIDHDAVVKRIMKSNALR